MSDGLPCFKVSGGGNDFIALIEPPTDPEGSQIRAWCSRGLSLGADGLFVLERRDAGAVMRYFNADGRPADLCINGTRCAARLALHLGWSEDEIEVETGAGTLRGRVTGPTTVALELPPPALAPVERTVRAAGESWTGWQVTIGVPHFVLLWERDLRDAPVGELGPELRSHPIFGDAGSNVDFVHITSRQSLEIRSFERGVEAETLACGTGVLAATATGLVLGALSLPVKALTLGGFELEVAGQGEEALPHRWSLSGDARIICEGQLHQDASALPVAPEWS